MTLEEASKYVNDAPDLKERQRRKAEVYHVLYGSPTGRMAVSKPNLQSVPLGSEEAKLIAAAFRKANK